MFSSEPDSLIAPVPKAREVRVLAGLVALFAVGTSVFAQAVSRKPELIRDHFRDDRGRTGPQLVALKGGEFIMGTKPSDPAYNTRNVQHRVVLSPFAVGQFQITNGEYAMFLNDQRLSLEQTEELIQVKMTPGLSIPGTGHPVSIKAGAADVPVTGVSWIGALGYTRWLSEKTGRIYTLPSEAQWEYCARADSKSIWPWGDLFDASKINCDRPIGMLGAEPASRLAQNAFGLYGIPGNVWEWMLDCLDVTFYFHAPSRDPVFLDPTCPAPMIRGGSFRTPQYQCSPGYRVNYFSIGHWDSIGFRVARRLD
jgi:formylglycine-generating enzyme required for sulfatase activity